MPELSEINIPGRKVPRYSLHRNFPSYRFVPGLNPHPTRDPDGHSYGVTADHCSVDRPWDPTDWRELDDWLWGVDLFNRFYFWEAHEAWEGLWATLKTEAPARWLLQGLIQITAALLKIHLDALVAAQRLSRAGLEKLRRAGADSPILLGLNCDGALHQLQQYFRPLESDRLPELDKTVPVLCLSVEAIPRGIAR